VTLDLHGQGHIVTPETGIKIALGRPIEVVQALADAVIDLCKHPKRYCDMSHAAHLFAKRQTWENKIKTIVARSY
jgi:predicted methyltransferase